MSEAIFSVDAKKIDDLADLIKRFGDDAREIINDELHDYGANEIKSKITELIPTSERTFKGHNFSAKGSMPGGFSQDDGNLSVTIAARGKYGYLYFPDDGSNTKNHAGNQHFMKQGGESAMDGIVDRITERLIERFE